MPDKIFSLFVLTEYDIQWQDYIKEIRKNPGTPFEKQWDFYQAAFKNKNPEDGPPLAWIPDQKALNTSNIARFMKELGFEDFTQLHSWSVQQREKFWEKTIKKLNIVFKKNPSSILNLDHGIKNPQWLPGARLNCVDSCFQNSNEAAILSASEDSDDIKTISYNDLEVLVNRTANGLIDHGFAKGDSIALCMPMTIECVTAYLAIIKAGCAVVSIADSFSADEIEKRIRISKAKAVITVDYYMRSGKTINIYSKILQANCPKAIVISDKTPQHFRENDLLWNELLSENETFSSVDCDPYDITNILFSSGTTAEPKAIPWNHLTPIKCAGDGYYHHDIQPGDVVAWPTNIGWMMGPWLIYAALINKATIALYEGSPTSIGFLSFVKNAKVSMLGVIPSLVRQWRLSGFISDSIWPDIRVFSSTGEPSNREDYLWLMSLTFYKAPVIEYLGGTEIGGGHITGSVVQPASPAKFTTPALGIDFVLLDDKNQPVKEGEIGELFILPPSIGLSQTLLNKDHEQVYYTNCPAIENAKILRRHGDKMMRLYKGFYKAAGRADDSMNLGGIKIGALEIEQVIEIHPYVIECAAISVQPDGEGQEKLVIYTKVKEKPDSKILQKELQKLIVQKLNPLFKIYDLIISENLPRTASGKLMRRSLRDIYNRSKNLPV